MIHFHKFRGRNIFNETKDIQLIAFVKFNNNFKAVRVLYNKNTPKFLK